MSGCADMARALYLELRALRLEVRAEDDPDGDILDFRIVIGGLHTLPESHARRIKQRVRDNEEGLVHLVLDGSDQDLDAIRREGHCW